MSTKTRKVYTIGYMIINNVSTIIGKRKTTVAEVAKAINVKYDTIQKLYKDETLGIKFKILNKLCWYLDCNTQDLVTYVPDKTPPLD